LGVKLNPTAENPATTTVSNLPPRKPSIVLEIDGVKYRFDRRQNLPKRAGKALDGDIKVALNGVETPAWITSNRGWAKDENLTIDYIWLNVAAGTDMGDGTANPEAQNGFITLDYTVDAKTFAGKEVIASVGTTERKNPDRVGKVGEDGTPLDAKRVAAFQEAMAKKKAAADQPTPAPAGEGAPASAETPPQVA
jgi:hypothetical protein